MADPIDKLLDKLDREIDYRDGLAPDVRLRRLTSRAIIMEFIEQTVRDAFTVEERLGKLTNITVVTGEVGPATTVRPLEE